MKTILGITFLLSLSSAAQAENCLEKAEGQAGKMSIALGMNASTLKVQAQTPSMRDRILVYAESGSSKLQFRFLIDPRNCSLISLQVEPYSR